MKRIAIWFNNLSVGRKLALGFTTLVVLTLLNQGIGYGLQFLVANPALALKDAVVDERRIAKDIQITLEDAHRQEKNFFLRFFNEGLDTAYDNYMTKNVDARNQAQALAKAALAVTQTDQEKQVLSQIIQGTQTYGNDLDGIIAAMRERGTSSSPGVLKDALDGFGVVADAASQASAPTVQAAAKDAQLGVWLYLHYSLPGSASDDVATVEIRKQAIKAMSDKTAAVKSAIAFSDLDDADKSRLRGLADTASSSFDRLVTVDDEIIAANSKLIADVRVYDLLPDQYAQIQIDQANEAQATYLSAVNVTGVVDIITLALALAISIALGVITTRSLARQAGEFDKVFGLVRVGDFDARAGVFGGDELGRAADGLNDMLEYMTNLLRGTLARMESLIQTATDTIITVDEDHNIVLFNEAAEKMFGVSADRVIGQPLNQLIPARFHNAHPRHLQNFARGSESGRGMGRGGRQLAALRADGTEFAVEASISQVEVEGKKLFSVIMREITARQEVQSNVSQMVNLLVEQAASSAGMAEQAAASAQEGDRAVVETIAAMGRIRENTQETARRIKRLGEVSKEIGEAVRLIEELSDRTTVLALNASIQAAAAGDAGRGFAVVAEEVQRLAERATGATRQIEDLVKNIQAETNEAVIGIEDATREVVEGSALAQQTGERVGELSRLVTDLSSLIQHVASTTAHQTTQSLAALTTGFSVSKPEDGGGNGHHEAIGELPDHTHG